MNRSHRLTALVLAVVMVLSLAACGSRETASSHPRPEYHGTVQRPVQTTPDRFIPEHTETTRPTEPALPVIPPSLGDVDGSGTIPPGCSDAAAGHQ